MYREVYRKKGTFRQVNYDLFSLINEYGISIPANTAGIALWESCDNVTFSELLELQSNKMLEAKFRIELFLRTELERLRQAGLVEIRTEYINEDSKEEPQPSFDGGKKYEEKESSSTIDQKDLVTPSYTWGTIYPPKGEAGLDGIYCGKGGVRIRVAGMTSENLRPIYHTFFPDGRSYTRIPEEGLENFNYEYWQKRHELSCRKYDLTKGTLEYLTCESPKKYIQVEEGGRVVQTSDSECTVFGNRYELLDRCNGLKLKGTYRSIEWETSEREPDKRGITFTLDGKFEDEGILETAYAMWSFPGRILQDEQGGRGLYKISNNTLELLYNDGRKRRINFHLTEGSSMDNPVGCRINTFEFVRVDQCNLFIH